MQPHSVFFLKRKNNTLVLNTTSYVGAVFNTLINLDKPYLLQFENIMLT